MTARLPLPTSGSRSKPLSSASFTRAARRLASVPFSSGSGSVVLLSRRSRDYAGVGSLVSAAAASGDTADAGSESILLSVQVRIPLSIESQVEFETLFPVVSSSIVRFRWLVNQACDVIFPESCLVFAGDDVRRVRCEREADPGEPSMFICSRSEFVRWNEEEMRLQHDCWFTF